jgi:hypothetical protein
MSAALPRCPRAPGFGSRKTRRSARHG